MAFSVLSWVATETTAFTCSFCPSVIITAQASKQRKQGRKVRFPCQNQKLRSRYGERDVSVVWKTTKVECFGSKSDKSPPTLRSSASTGAILEASLSASASRMLPTFMLTLSMHLLTSASLILASLSLLYPLPLALSIWYHLHLHLRRKERKLATLEKNQEKKGRKKKKKTH